MQNVRTVPGEVWFRVSGQVTLGMQEKRQPKRPGVFSPRPVAPGYQAQRRRVHHLIRKRVPDEMSLQSRGRAVSQPCLPGSVRTEGHARALRGRLSLQAAPSGLQVPHRSANSTPAGIPCPLGPKYPGLCLRRTRGCAFAQDRGTF